MHSGAHTHAINRKITGLYSILADTNILKTINYSQVYKQNVGKGKYLALVKYEMVSRCITILPVASNTGRWMETVYNYNCKHTNVQ